LSIKDYFPVCHDATTIIYQSAKMICFNVERNYNGRKTKTPFLFTPSLKLDNGTKLYLSAVIMHHGSGVLNGHYTCMIKDGKRGWFHHDDMHTEIERIGSFKNMMDDGFVSKNCVMLVYGNK
jgi:hypothetical protein